MNCNGCLHWVLKRRRVYDDGTERVYFQVFGGKGLCEVLKSETAPDFGCTSFAASDTDHVFTDAVAGAPWQHFKMGDCPGCCGKGCDPGGGICDRCVGTGNVRYYEDGYVGEERTRRHPKDPEPPALWADDPEKQIVPASNPIGGVL